MDASPGLEPTRATVTVAWAGTRGDPVTVTVVYDDPVLVPFVSWLVGDGVTITADATARQEFTA